MLFGMAVDAIGIALAFAELWVGYICRSGKPVCPFFSCIRRRCFTSAGLGVLLGVLLVLVGVSVCAIAGRKREHWSTIDSKPGMSFAAGLGLRQ